MSIFEKATKKKLRFATNKGSLSTEDLWDLSLQSLNLLAIAANKEIKAEGEENYIGTRSAKSTELQLKFDIIKYIIDFKLAEQEATKKRSEKAAKTAQLRELLEQKELEALGSLSAEDIKKQLAELEEA